MFMSLQRSGLKAEMTYDYASALESYRAALAMYDAAYAESPNRTMVTYGGREQLSETVRRLEKRVTSNRKGER